MKVLLLIVGLTLATVGGVITFRALYVEPKTAVIITDTDIRQLPNYARVVGGALLFVGGTALALYGATRKVKELSFKQADQILFHLCGTYDKVRHVWILKIPLPFAELVVILQVQRRRQNEIAVVDVIRLVPQLEHAPNLAHKKHVC